MTQPLYYHRQETIHDISFGLGFAWAGLTHEARSYILENIGGARELAARALVWAEEFDVQFAPKLNTTQIGEYLEDIDAFFHTKWDELIVKHVAQRMTEGATE